MIGFIDWFPWLIWFIGKLMSKSPLSLFLSNLELDHLLILAKSKSICEKCGSKDKRPAVPTSEKQKAQYQRNCLRWILVKRKKTMHKNFRAKFPDKYSIYFEDQTRRK